MKNSLKALQNLITSITIIFLVSLTFISKGQNIGVNYNSSQLISEDNNVSMSVYPNPAVDEAKLVFNSDKYDLPYQIRIINNNGVQLTSFSGTTFQGQNTIRIHVGNYSSGIYYIQLLTAHNKATLKLLKQPVNGF